MAEATTWCAVGRPVSSDMRWRLAGRYGTDERELVAQQAQQPSTAVLSARSNAQRCLAPCISANAVALPLACARFLREHSLTTKNTSSAGTTESHQGARLHAR